MGRTTLARAALLLTAVLLAGFGAGACKTQDWPVAGEGAPAVSDSIDFQVTSYLANNQLPGATLAVTRNGRLVWSKAYGYANQGEGVEMRPWHRSRIGSVSKILTTIGVLQLVEDGKLALDDPLYGHPGAVISDPAWPDVDEDTVLADPEAYWDAILEGVVDMYSPAFVGELFKTVDWASEIELGHLLSHTSGLLRSGHIDQVEDFYGKDRSDITYPEVHLAVLKGAIDEREDSVAVKCYQEDLYIPGDDVDFTGQWYRMPPFVFEPGTDRCYSNHGFGLLGHIIDEQYPERTYRQAIDDRVLHPLGLHGVVPNNTSLDDGLDAWPHGDALDPDNPSRFQATGGWSASARDLARVMCSLDRGANLARVLRPETVQTMEAVAYPAADTDQPLGWDWRSGNRLYKNGSTGGGMSVIMKFLPGSLAAAPQDEINVAIAINGSDEDKPSVALLQDIADKVAAAAIPDGYDLFDPAHRCVGEDPTVTITDPNDGTEFPLGTEILFEAEAWGADGAPLPITWTLPGTAVETQPGIGGKHSLFHDDLTVGTHTIRAATIDVGGHRATDEITVEITYDAPEVAIVSHQDGDTVPAGEPLFLVGQSTVGPFPLSDDQVEWTLERDGGLVHTGDGHSTTVPAGVMQPGSYVVTFHGADGVSVVSDDLTITAEPKPATDPVATIVRPRPGSSYTVTGGLGTKASVLFAGMAVDSDGDPIGGTRFRWTTTWDGAEIVLCHGTDTPGQPPSGNGGLVVKRNCESFTASLTGHHYAGYTNYPVTLEVWDADGNTDTASTTVRVFVPPVG
jgi:CubicO group peptidase (beta-lactamase class C family)